MQAVTILGSNQGDKCRILRQAVSILAAEAGRVTGKSSLYETASWGFESNENFLNQVVLFETPLSPSHFLDCCLQTEARLGRIRTQDGPRYASRPIDIDLLFYDSLIIETPELQIPHPRLSERNFVLVPLTEVMPGFMHPVLKKTIAQLLAECPDTCAVHPTQEEDL